jgi:hypothetical protein
MRFLPFEPSYGLQSDALVTIFTCAISLSPVTEPVSQNVNTQDMDRSVKPGDDF